MKSSVGRAAGFGGTGFPACAGTVKPAATDKLPVCPSGAGGQSRFPDGLHYPEFFTEAGQALQQAVQFPRGQQLVPPAQAADDLLLDLAALPVGADDPTVEDESEWSEESLFLSRRDS